MKPLSVEYAEAKLRDAMDAGDLAAMDHFSELVDMLQAMHARPPATLADAARWYGSIGLHVFPLAARSKVPRKGSHGLDDATSDALQIAQWWGTDPTANIGIATGHVVDVLDIDGERGELSLAHALQLEAPPRHSSGVMYCDACSRSWDAVYLRETHCSVCSAQGRELADNGVTTQSSLMLKHVIGIVSTPRAGGRHLYVPAKSSRSNGAQLVDGIDVRALGGYVVAPPSVLDVGAYSWTRTLDLRTLLITSSP